MQQLIDFLNEKVNTDTTVKELLDIFEEMCRIDAGEDYDEIYCYTDTMNFNGAELFTFGLYRDLIKITNGNEKAVATVSAEAYFPFEDKNTLFELQNQLSQDDYIENIFDIIRSCDAYVFAEDRKPYTIDIRLSVNE